MDSTAAGGLDLIAATENRIAGQVTTWFLMSTDEYELADIPSTGCEVISMDMDILIAELLSRYRDDTGAQELDEFMEGTCISIRRRQRTCHDI